MDELKINDLVIDVYCDEVARVLELIKNENKARIQYIGNENYLKDDIIECELNQLERIK